MDGGNEWRLAPPGFVWMQDCICAEPLDDFGDSGRFEIACATDACAGVVFTDECARDAVYKTCARLRCHPSLTSVAEKCALHRLPTDPYAEYVPLQCAALALLTLATVSMIGAQWIRASRNAAGCVELDKARTARYRHLQWAELRRPSSRGRRTRRLQT